MLLSLSPVNLADWNLFSLLIQCGWLDWDSLWCLYMCVCVCVQMNQLSVCVNVFERESQREEETLGV